MAAWIAREKDADRCGIKQRLELIKITLVILAQSLQSFLCLASLGDIGDQGKETTRQPTLVGVRNVLR
ncbi:hypothetical protein CCR91_21105 [Thiorhodovibrio winogradskyi]|nr:hypothetical protein [Thiorhodovibrio winogradskyi]